MQKSCSCWMSRSSSFQSSLQRSSCYKKKSVSKDRTSFYKKSYVWSLSARKSRHRKTNSGKRN